MQAVSSRWCFAVALLRSKSWSWFSWSNCLSKWYVVAAEKRGKKVDYEEAREIIYGMPYSEWKKKHQTEATQEQMNQWN